MYTSFFFLLNLCTVSLSFHLTHFLFFKHFITSFKPPVVPTQNQYNQRCLTEVWKLNFSGSSCHSQKRAFHIFFLIHIGKQKAPNILMHKLKNIAMFPVLIYIQTFVHVRNLVYIIFCVCWVERGKNCKSIYSGYREYIIFSILL